jgi:hypothetical protein
MSRPFRATLMLLVLFAAGPRPDAFAQSSPHNPGVVLINARYAGLTYGEWSARWWQWYWATATVDSPSLDATGVLAGEGQSGPVWFLTWPLVEPHAVRQITIPAGKALLFPATNHDSLLDLPSGATLDERRQAAQAIFEWIVDTSASVDGVPIKELTSYAATSPAYNVTLPVDNIFGIPAGTYGPTFSAGYYVLLKPLAVGRHTVEFSFQFFWPPAGQVLSLNTTYYIDVVPRH